MGHKPVKIKQCAVILMLYGSIQTNDILAPNFAPISKLLVQTIRKSESMIYGVSTDKEWLMTVIKGSWQGFVVSGFLQSISERSLTLITVGKSADEILVPRRVKFEFLVSVSEICVVQQMMENT